MSNWKELAKAAEQARRKARHGEREAAIRAVAPTKDVDLVRRKIPVARFAERLRKAAPELADSLDSKFSHLQILARWAAIDLEAALEAAEKCAGDGYSVAKLKLAYKNFLQQVGASRPGRDLAPTQPLLKAIEDLLGGKVSVLAQHPGVRGGRAIDLEINVANGKASRRVGVVLVGPYANAVLYKQRMHQVLLQALGLAWMFDDVVVLLPEGAKIDAYQSDLMELLKEVSMPPAAGQPPGIHLLPMKLDYYGRSAQKRGSGHAI